MNDILEMLDMRFGGIISVNHGITQASMHEKTSRRAKGSDLRGAGNEVAILQYLRGDDIEEVPSRRILLAEHVAVVCLKEHIESLDDERTAAECRVQAIFTQKGA